MDYITLIVGGLLSVICLLYLYLIRNNNYWESRGVKCRKPQLFFGNLKDRVLVKISNHEFVQEFYKEMKGEQFAGMYEGTKPVLYVFNPELIKLILVRNFEHYMDRPIIHFRDMRSEKMLIGLKGNEWKTIRGACTPAFSSRKLKAMFPLIADCGQQMIDYLNKVTNVKGETILDFKPLLINYTLNTIATTIFGINLDTFSDKESEFSKYAFNLQELPIYRRIIILICILLEIPNWITIHLPIAEFNIDSFNFFHKLTIEAMDYRIANNVRRNDLLQLMIDAQTGHDEMDEEISNEKKETIDKATAIAQCLLFLIVGFETSSTQLTMTCYELAKNKDVQEKARKNINDHWNKDGILTYEAIDSMTYLHMILYETVRLYPPVPSLERVVTKTTDLCGLKLDIGTKILIPLSGLNSNPEYYEDPMAFKPERYTQEEKLKRNPYLNLGFGTGPRYCIGTRLATIFHTVCTAYLLKHFEIDICEKTPLPFEYDRLTYFMKPKDDIYLKLTRVNL